MSRSKKEDLLTLCQRKAKTSMFEAGRLARRLGSERLRSKRLYHNYDVPTLARQASCNPQVEDFKLVTNNINVIKFSCMGHFRLLHLCHFQSQFAFMSSIESNGLDDFMPKVHTCDDVQQST